MMSDDLPLLTGLFSKGDRVRIMDGKYLGKTGTVTEIRGDRVMVLGESGQKQVAFKPGSLVIIPPQGSVVGELDDMLMSARIPPRVQPTSPPTQAGSDLDDLLSSERISSAGHTPWVSPADSPESSPVTGENSETDWEGDSGNGATYSRPSPEASPTTSPATGETSRCRGCGQPIVWQRTASGKRTPVNLDGSTHWATCSQASTFKSSPELSPATGENWETDWEGDSGNGATLSRVSPASSPTTSPELSPATGENYRERAIAALEVAIAQLKPKAMTGAWISIRTKGERSYYSLRRMVDGKEKEQAILASEVPIYQRRIDEGRIVVEAIKIVQMLRQMDE